MTVNDAGWKFGTIAACIGVLALLWSAPAFAQAEDQQETSDTEQGSSASDDGDSDEEEDRLPDLDEEHPLYWAEMRQVYTMQHRAFLKEGRFSATLYGGIIPNNIFEQYFPLGLRVNYYLLENIGLEASTSYNFNRLTELNDIVEDPQGIGASGSVLIGDTQLSHTTVGVSWSPVYGKFSFYEDQLFYFDMYAFGGAGVVVAQTQSSHGDDPSTTAKPEGVLGAGLAAYLGDHAGIRVDYRQFVFPKVAGIGGVANPSEVSVGVSWFF